MSEEEQEHPDPSVSVPGSHPSMPLWLVVPVIGLLGLALAAGLKFPGTVDQFDRLVASLLAATGLSAPVHSLSPLILWSGSGVLALALAAVILNIAGWWRRVFIFLLAVLLTLSWAPVLWLASHKPEIGVAVVGVLWSGCCAMFYAYSHEMPADAAEKEQMKMNDGAR